jgi:hypothetical protein
MLDSCEAFCSVFRKTQKVPDISKVNRADTSSSCKVLVLCEIPGRAVCLLWRNSMILITQSRFTWRALFYAFGTATCPLCLPHLSSFCSMALTTLPHHRASTVPT